MTSSEELRKRFDKEVNPEHPDPKGNGHVSISGAITSGSDVTLQYIEWLESQITGKSLPTNEEIQAHIENNCRNEHGEPMMSEQEFYEGAKWMRDNHLNQKRLNEKNNA